MKTPRWTSLLCSLLVALGSLSSAISADGDAAKSVKNFPPPKRATIPKVKGELRIDGKLDEAVWKEAAVLKPFSLNDGKGPGAEATEVRIWYDDQALYLGWTCVDADIEATFTQRDSKFWEEEVAEFFITPTPENLSRYFELQWNPLGGVFDAIINNELDSNGLSKGIKGDWSFTAAGMKSSVLVIGTVANPNDRDEQWTAEVKIPFSDLQHAAPKPGEVWRGNFFRFNRGKGHPAEQLSWSPTLLPSFHEPSRFGYLEFK